VVSPTEVKLCQLLKAEEQLGSSVNLTLLRLNEWTKSIRAGGLDATVTGASARATFSPAAELIENIAESLIQSADGFERRLLSKSLQETLLYCIGLDTRITRAQLKVRLAEFLKRKGPAVLIQQFLSLCFFNFVWFQTSDSFRASAETDSAFEKDIENVERLCERAVASSWEAYESIQRPLDSPAAKELIRNIENRLRGV
jgi:hypothetical protein